MHPYVALRDYFSSLGEKHGVRLPLSTPPSPDLGDFAVPAGFALAKVRRTSPDRAAEDFIADIDHPLVREARATGGYVNLFVDREKYAEALLAGEWTPEKTGKRVVLDYSSPNIARPMHVGHLRSTLIGESLKRVYAFMGWDTYAINYPGDIGTQFGKLIYAYNHWVDREALAEDPVKELFRIYVKFHEEAEKNPSIEDEARRILAELEGGKHRDLWQKFRDWTLQSFNKLYSRLGVEFDEISGESFYVERAKEIARELLRKGVVYEDDGAVIAEHDGEKAVLLRSDGATVYLTRDIAALLDRVERLHPDRLIYVVGAEQASHFRILFALARKAGVSAELVHVAFAHILLPEGRMSTRRGKVVFAEDVINRAVALAAEEMKKRGHSSPADAEKVGIGALSYAILRVEPEKNVVFDWAKVLSFDGDTGPYCQYAAVRARRILEKAGEYSPKVLEPDEAEWELIRQLSLFPQALEDVIRTNKPHHLARYAYALARHFHLFYERCPVLADEKRRDFRLNVVGRFYNVLSTALRMLLVEVPERM